MKHALSAVATLALGACGSPLEVREPTQEEQALIDEIMDRGAHEHESVAAMIRASENPFFTPDGTPATPEDAVAAMHEAADLLAQYHREGKILMFDPSAQDENTTVGGLPMDEVEGVSHTAYDGAYIALNAAEIDRIDFSTLMHEASHQLAPDRAHHETFSELSHHEGDQTAQTEAAFAYCDFPHLASVEYGWLDDTLGGTVAWLDALARELQQRVDAGELSAADALAEYDERAAYESSTREIFAQEQATDAFTLNPEFYTALGNSEKDLETALLVEGPYAFIDDARTEQRQELEHALAEREEGERRLMREQEQSHRTRRR